jgi:uncharacterized protein YecE (DUF72 family)
MTSSNEQRAGPPIGASRRPIQIGCCGWSYNDWVGPFYPEGTAPGEYLARYAEQYDVVEVDSTFYATPARRTVEGWYAKTPEHFRFCLKVPQVITHEKMLRDCKEERDGFLAVVELLHEKLHSVCLQFGYFNRQKFASLAAFLDVLEPFLADWPPSVPLAVEIRNKNWLTPVFTDCLRRHNAAMVLVQQSWMPPPGEVLKKLDPLTGPFAYVRFLGDREAIERITTTWDRVVVDCADELSRVAQALNELAARAPVLVFVNNHYAGFAPETAEMLRRLIES